MADLSEPRASFFKRSKLLRNKHHPEGLGKQVDIKTFYESPTLDEYPGAINWVENDPPALPASKKLRFQGAAIHIYKRAQRDAGMYGNSIPFVADTIKLQSPYLREMLDEVLEKHGAVRNDHKGHTEITKPFKPLFYEREKIQQLADTTDDSDIKEHLNLLVGVVRDVLAPILDQLEETEACGEVTYKDLWTLFVPNEMAVCKSEGCEHGARIVNTSYCCPDEEGQLGKHFKVRTQRIRFNGLQFGFNEKKFYINEFSGKKKIQDLIVYPLRLDKDINATRRRLEEYGKHVLEYQDVEYAILRSMSGDLIEVATGEAMDDFWRTDRLVGLVVIDFFGYSRRNKSSQRVIKTLPEYKAQESINFFTMESHDDTERGDGSKGVDPSAACRPNAEQKAFSSKIMLASEDYLYMMYPLLDGFSLNKNLWGAFNVAQISRLTASSEAYDHLVMPPRKKDLIYSIVKSHKLWASSQNDVVSEKGKGLLILLSGPPGVGKTLCAEAIAGKLCRPLFVVSPWDFNGAESVSEKLSELLRRANEWNAILLVDEADVFLRKRGYDEFSNAVVSTFLRHLERHKGVVFLVTNLFHDLDIAVESRAHIHVQFSDLDRSSRRLIWSRFVARVPEINDKIGQSELDELAKWRLNGRQIKNALMMARAWCLETSTNLSVTVIEETIDLAFPNMSREQDDDTESGVVLVNGESTRSAKDDLLELI